MSEVRLVVREAERDWSGNMHGSCADRAVAALSADPVTLDELEVAVGRFAKRSPERRYFGNLRPGLHDEPHDAGLVVIDLVARLIVVDSTFSCPSLKGTEPYHNGNCCTDIDIPFHLTDDWKISHDRECWQVLAEQRRHEREAKPHRDVREVFYGRPLLEFIAREVFAAFARRDAIAAGVRAEWMEEARERLAKKAGIAPDRVDESLLTAEEITPKTYPGQEIYASVFYDTIKEIHAAWLLTPREDLGGACPREVVFEQHDNLSRDLQDRCHQWSLMDVCPPGLEKSSHAFQYAGFGTHELVKYYDLVRELLWSCWDQLAEQMQKVVGRLEASTVGDFLTTEVPRLERAREQWLDAPDLECHGRTPRSIIDRERARLPEGMSSHDAMVDPDCPCCQMIADMPGPSFWHLDGSGMDDEFAFNIRHRTREEWEEERHEWDELSRKFDAKWAERERLGVTDSMSSADGKPNVWQRSFQVTYTAEVPLGMRVFGLGGHLAELIVGLRAGSDRSNTPDDAQRHIDQLNRDFGNLRELLQSADASLAETLIGPVLDRFNETLAVVVTARRDLAPQCDSLTIDLHKLLDPPPPPKPAWNANDPELPF